MVYLKTYSLTAAKITIAIVMIDAREYYKNINPLGLSDNHTTVLLKYFVDICHELSHFSGVPGREWSQYFKNSLPAQYNKTGNKMTMSRRLYYLITTYVDYMHDRL